VYSMRPPVVHVRWGLGGQMGGGEGGMDSGITADLGAGILEHSMGARNRIGIGYIGWRNRFLGTRNLFLGIDSWAP
jgi:hypothetical protein